MTKLGGGRLDGLLEKKRGSTSLKTAPEVLRWVAWRAERHGRNRAEFTSDLLLTLCVTSLVVFLPGRRHHGPEALPSCSWVARGGGGGGV